MATHTDYFNLEKPESYENYNIAVFNDNADTIDLQMHNNQVSAAKVMVGATSLADGESGRVPTPHAGDEDKYLKGDGTWAAGNSNVEANPSGTPTETLETIGIDNVIYQLPEGGDTEITGDEEGSVISIDDGKLNEPLKACTVDINPVQSGSGTPSPSNIRPISGWTEANITVAGKNLYDETQTLIKGRYTSDGSIAGTSSELNKHTGLIKIQGGKTYTYYNAIPYTVQIYGVWFDADEQYISTFVLPKSPTTTSTAIAPNNACYAALSIYNETDQKVQFEVGATATDYEAYNGTTYNIEFEDSGSPLTVYGGTLDTVSGALTVTGAIIDLGTLSYAYDSSGVRFYAIVPQLKSMNQWDGAYGYCSNYEKGRIGSGGATDGLTVGFGLYGIYVYIRDTRYSDVTSFREAMNGVQLVYELTTPTEVSLTPTEITTLYGNNNIWADSGDMAITYVRDTSIAINDALNQSITPTYSSGTKIADYNVGGQTGAIYVQGAGGHKDVLWTGSETPTMSYNPTIQLAHPISDYDFLLINFNIDNEGTYLKATLTLYGATVGDNFAQAILPSGYAAMYVNILNDNNITLNCYGRNYENTTTYISIIGVKL